MRFTIVLHKVDYYGTLDASSRESLTVPRNDLYDIDGTSVGKQVFPPPYEKPVIPAINPLEGHTAQSGRKGGEIPYVLVP